MVLTFRKVGFGSIAFIVLMSVSPTLVAPTCQSTANALRERLRIFSGQFFVGWDGRIRLCHRWPHFWTERPALKTEIFPYLLYYIMY